jgi:hypothetical protein
MTDRFAAWPYLTTAARDILVLRRFDRYGVPPVTGGGMRRSRRRCACPRRAACRRLRLFGPRYRGAASRRHPRCTFTAAGTKASASASDHIEFPAGRTGGRGSIVPAARDRFKTVLPRPHLKDVCGIFGKGGGRCSYPAATGLGAARRLFWCRVSLRCPETGMVDGATAGCGRPLQEKDGRCRTMTTAGSVRSISTA